MSGDYKETSNQLGVANRWRRKDLYIYVSESVKAILTI